MQTEDGDHDRSKVIYTLEQASVLMASDTNENGYKAKSIYYDNETSLSIHKASILKGRIK